MKEYLEKRESKTQGVRWRVRISVDADHGGPRVEYHGTYATQGEARKQATAVLERYYHGSASKPSRMTLADLYAAWREVKEPEWAANTERDHRLNWENHIEPYLGDVRAERLTPHEVARWQAQRLKQGRLRPGAKPEKSVRNYRGTLHAMYAWAQRMGLFAVNPVSAVRPPKWDRAEHDALTVAEMRALVESLRGTRFWPGLLIASSSAMRRGEFLALRWSDLRAEREGDLWVGGVNVHAKRGNLTGLSRVTLKFGPPKTKAGARFVPLPSAALAELVTLRNERRAAWALGGLPWDNEALICCSATGQPIVPDNFSSGLRRTLKRRGLPSTHPHAFRHGVIEAMLAGGERADEVASIAGHSSASTTVGIYAHVTAASRQALMERFGRVYEAAESEPETSAAASSSSQIQSHVVGENEESASS